MRILLKPDQSGTADIEIAATDGSFRVSDSFLLTVIPVPDSPIADDDGYNVPVGSKLQILNPSDGLLRNDTDADGDVITVDLNSVTQPTFGTLEVNENGTFVYTSLAGEVGDIDSFSYRVLDSTGRASETVTVSLELNRSRYQNPLKDLSEDVNADGQITSIDALRIINFLNRTLDGSSPTVPVSEIGEPPPNYYDANGDGQVSTGDALRVINMIGRLLDRSEGESVSSLAASATTTSFVSGSSVSHPVRHLEPVSAAIDEADPHDTVLASGFEIVSTAKEQAVEAVSADSKTASTPGALTKPLSLLMDEPYSGRNLGIARFK